MDFRGVPVDNARRPSPVALITLATGLLVTAALAVTTLLLYERNESRLLSLRAREVGLLLSTSTAPRETDLATAATLADATNGNAASFRALVGSEVGPGRQFSSESLWPLGSNDPRPTVVVGATPQLSRAEATELFARAAKIKKMSVLGLLQSPRPGIGYAFAAARGGRGFVAYAETVLPADRRSKFESNTAFSDLNYAIYLGRSPSPANLLVTDLKKLPIRSRHASSVAPLGDQVLTLVVTPRGSLGGTFFQILPWIVGFLGLLLSLTAALVADRLARRRERAEQLAEVLDRLAGETERMYDEQRSIAQTLQHALLPDTLPNVGGLDVSARYVTAGAGVEVGGDWYDLVAAGEHRALLVIGDVSGHGLRAATTMASLRHATLAYAAHDPRPAVVLKRLSSYVNSSRHEYFATVLCALIDVDAHQLSVSSAGHLPPLLLDDNGAHYMQLTASAPIGVAGETDYQEASVSVTPHATLVAFTDGLVERRAEVIDVGLERLRDAASTPGQSLEELIATLPLRLASDGHHDDTAIVGIQWQS